MRTAADDPSTKQQPTTEPAPYAESVSSVDGDAGEHTRMVNGQPPLTAIPPSLKQRQRLRQRHRMLIGGAFLGLFILPLLLSLVFGNKGGASAVAAARRHNKGRASRVSLTASPAPQLPKRGPSISPPPPPAKAAKVPLRHAPPPQAPYPPMPPFPQRPPLSLLPEPSVLGSCGHLAGPIDTSERAVTYPGGAWQYFAEWSGLDEAAEAEFEDGDLSYYYYDEVRMPCCLCPPLLLLCLR